MRRLSWPVVFPLLTCVVAAFGVFVLPFFFPPAFTSSVSVSNAAGFNNKLAAVAAAACAVLVFALSARNKPIRNHEPFPTQHALPIQDHSNISPWIWIASALLLSALIAFAAWQVHVSGLMYPSDVGYFVNQMRSNAVYNRSLYAQIELPYGPLLFYPPILLHSALRHWHTSLQTCYFLILVLNQFLGILLLGYVVSRLRIRRNWQIFILCCFVPFALQPMLGLNYTWLRFIMPFATLLFCTAQKNLWITSVLLWAGVVLNLATSPEMGFAFAATALTYASLQIRSKGPKWALAVMYQ